MKKLKPQKKVSKKYKYLVKSHGDFVLDFSEFMRNKKAPCWFIGHGTCAGNTNPIPSGLHSTPREAWRAAAVALGLTVRPKAWIAATKEAERIQANLLRDAACGEQRGPVSLVRAYQKERRNELSIEPSLSLS